jgi:hypothetical protein
VKDEPRRPQSSNTDEWDSQPTQQLSSADLATMNRVATAKTDEMPVLPVEPPPPEMRVSQAIRVKLWKDASGIHVAPAQETVSAIAIETFLVALDPTVDLAGWFSDAPGPKR